MFQQFFNVFNKQMYILQNKDKNDTQITQSICSFQVYN